MVVIGGDGSFRGAQKLSANGINTIGIPGTIDLDIACTEYTIGFDTACNTAMEAIDKVRDTSASHERCSIIEVMGRTAGHIALWCGISNGSEYVLIPERAEENDEEEIIRKIISKRRIGKKHHIIVNAEGVGHSHEMAKRIEVAGKDKPEKGGKERAKTQIQRDCREFVPGIETDIVERRRHVDNALWTIHFAQQPRLGASEFTKQYARTFVLAP